MYALSSLSTGKKCALLAVYDKDGIHEFARELLELGYDLVGSKGTAAAIVAAGMPCIDVATFAGEAILGHRVVTLSREVAAGLLARHLAEDIGELGKQAIRWIDLVLVDLYPLEREIRSPKATEESVTEMTDVGGPTMLREAAKGRRIVISRREDRRRVLDWIRIGQPDRPEMLRELAGIAETVVTKYSGLSAEYLGKGRTVVLVGEDRIACKYGENPDQSPAAYYSFGTDDPLAVERFEAIAGTDPSYNIITDFERNLQTATHIAAAFESNHCGKPHFTVATKHGEPCGASYSSSEPTQSLLRAIHGSLEEIHGGTIFCTYPIDEELAQIMRRSFIREEEPPRLIDCVLAPSFTDEAVAVLRRPGENKCRLFANPALASLGMRSLDAGRRLRYVRGGMLVQPNYAGIIDLAGVATYRRGERAITAIEDDLARDLLLAWAVCATSKSNTITLAKDRKIIANGVGQRSRKRCVEVALSSAAKDGHDVHDAVLASDGFFPYDDAPVLAVEAGVKHILTCSGAMRDKDIIALTAKHDFTLYMTPGRFFYAH